MLIARKQVEKECSRGRLPERGRWPRRHGGLGFATIYGKTFKACQATRLPKSTFSQESSEWARPAPSVRSVTHSMTIPSRFLHIGDSAARCAPMYMGE